jgi:hypothetical protein
MLFLSGESGKSRFIDAFRQENRHTEVISFSSVWRAADYAVPASYGGVQSFVQLVKQLKTGLHGDLIETTVFVYSNFDRGVSEHTDLLAFIMLAVDLFERLESRLNFVIVTRTAHMSLWDAKRTVKEIDPAIRKTIFGKDEAFLQL